MKTRLWNLHLAGLAVAVLLCGSAAGSEADGWAEVEHQFRELPSAARRTTGPLFWLHGDESPQQLELYVEKIAAGGNGCFTAESRPHNDWLGPGWYRDLEICLNAAKKHDLKMWIFDELWWPSQMVGGNVPPEHGTKFLQAERTAIAGPAPFQADGFGGPQFVAAIAGRESADGKIDAATLLDLSSHIQAGQLRWEAPEGRWSILKFTWRYAGAQGHQKAWISVDGASRESVQWFLQHVYQPHYDRFQADFGQTIVGYFYDEPETQGDWGTELIPEFQRRGADWKAALVAWKFELADPQQQTAAQYLYRDAFAEAWGRTMYGGMSAWCRARGVKSIGHFMEHGRLYLHPTYCAGNMFQLQKYSDMGAIDLVVRQMYPGQRPHDIYQTPKLASSISHVYGKEDDLAMCEIFGGYNQNLTYPEMKWLTDQHQVRGVNFMIPHSFNPRAPYDSDYPPYFFNNGFEPRWPLYRVYADYTSRLSAMLTGGHHVCDVAQLYLGHSYQAGKAVTPEDMTTALQDALFDCDWMPYDVFEHDAQIAGNELDLRKEQYRVLIVPAAEVIPYETLAKAQAFLDAGGVVLGYGLLPSKSATLGKTTADIATLRSAIWGDSPEPGVDPCRVSDAGGRAYFLPEIPTPEQIRQVLTIDAGIHPALEVLQGETNGWLHVLHRVKAGRDVFFIANQHHDGPLKPFRLRVRAGGVPEAWDAMCGTIASLPFTRIDENLVEFDLVLEPLESALIVFQAEPRALPQRLAPGTKPLREPLEVRRLPTPPELLVPSGPPEPQEQPAALAQLAGCVWVWYPEGDPARSAPPGQRYFRRQLVVPEGREIAQARFVLTADNDFTLFINGIKAGGSDGAGENWRHPLVLDVAKHLRLGENQLAIAALNATDEPSPAGLLGRLRVMFDAGDPLDIRIDGSWRTENKEVSDWTALSFDDAPWPAAREVAGLGAPPWGHLSGSPQRLTTSPVKSDPFVGRFTLPADWRKPGWRICLEASEIQPEHAASVNVNGQSAGGFIGRPSRLEVTSLVRPGENTVEIVPFAPQAVRLVVYPDGT